MAFPVIKVDSATGSDTAASGAGPATALTGSAGVSSASGLSVILDGSPDLSGVSILGDHVLYFADATAGNRNFGKITATANSGTPTAAVTVSDAFGIALTKAWAIGGKRASIGGTNSSKLLDNNGASGDWMPGWVVELQSGHTESIAATISLRRAGDTTSGPLILRGVAGAAVLPKITATAAINIITMRSLYQIVRDMELTAGAASMTSGVNDTVGNATIDGIKLSRTSTNTFTNGFTSSGNFRVMNSEIQRCSVGILAGDTNTLLSNYIHDCTSHGISLGGNSLGQIVVGNIITLCGGDGINWAFTGSNNRSGLIMFNTIDSCTSDGIEISGAVGDGYGNVRICNNILSNNGAYGLNFSNGSVTDAYLAALSPLILGNQTYLNTSGAYKSATGGYAYNAAPWVSGDNNLNPTYTNAGLGDYSIGTNLKAKGYPLGGTLYVGKYSTTYSYVDPGAVQRQEAGGSAGMLYHTGGG